MDQIRKKEKEKPGLENTVFSFPLVRIFSCRKRFDRLENLRGTKYLFPLPPVRIFLSKKSTHRANTAGRKNNLSDRMGVNVAYRKHARVVTFSV